jgi:uncharacterized iron-regulated membrane protein
VGRNRGANWLRSPQRVWLRRALFQVHLWVGNALAIYAVVIGLSGSALVFRDEIERAMWPAVFHVAPIERSITIQSAVDQLQSERPGWVVFALRDFNTAGYLQLPATRAGVAQYKATGYYSGSLPYSELVRVTIDARTGDVLSYGDTRKDSRGSRVEQYFTTIHFGSFGGDGLAGTAIKWLWVLVGIAPALLAVTGLIMYWNRKLRPAWLRMQRRKVIG